MLKRDICQLDTKEIRLKNTFIIMNSKTSSITFGFVLTMCLMSTTIALPLLSEEEKAKLSQEQIQKLRDILEPGGRIRPGMLSNMKYDTSRENLNPDESLDIITTTFRPDETSIFTTSDESNEIAKKIVKLPFESDLLLNNIPDSIIRKSKRHRKKSKVIVKCFNCTINL